MDEQMGWENRGWSTGQLEQGQESTVQDAFKELVDVPAKEVIAYQFLFTHEN